MNVLMTHSEYIYLGKNECKYFNEAKHYKSKASPVSSNGESCLNKTPIRGPN
jgi:hypothetical protein